MTVTLLLELCVTPEKFMCNEFRLNLCKVKKIDKIFLDMLLDGLKQTYLFKQATLLFPQENRIN